MSIVVGVPAGIVSALRRNSIRDVATRFGSLAALSVPDFVLGTLLIYVVSTRKSASRSPATSRSGSTSSITCGRWCCRR
jgi:ABC-type dipeptide/oligopeptide/nickel transport system permease component